jgi:hypothetical protein
MERRFLDFRFIHSAQRPQGVTGVVLLSCQQLRKMRVTRMTPPCRFWMDHVEANGEKPESDSDFTKYGTGLVLYFKFMVRMCL